MNSRRIKGDGTVRKRSDGRWEGRFVDSTGKIRYIYRYSKTEVNEELKKLGYIQSVSLFDNVGGDIDFDTWFEHYCEMKSLSVKERSLYQIKSAYKNHIKPIVGKKLMYKINQNDVLAVAKSVKNKGLSNCGISNVITHFSGMIRFAVNEGVIQKNPLVPIKTNNKSQKPRRNLTPTEVNYILEEAETQEFKFYLMLYTLVSTGMRVGEVCGLKWNDFSKDYSSVHINEGHTDNIYETDLKSKNAERIAYLSSDLQVKYEKFYRICGGDQNPYEHVFINRRKNLYTDQVVEKRLHYITQMIYEKHDIDLRFVTPHYFRHTFCTVGMDNGVLLQDMKELMGHADIRTTMKYVHTNEERKNRSALKITENVLSEHNTEPNKQLEELENLDKWSISGQLNNLSKTDKGFKWHGYSV